MSHVPGSKTPERLILVIDDQAVVRARLGQALSDAGLRAELAADWRGALNHVAQGCPDVIVCDLSLPDADGPALVKAARAIPDCQHVPTILTSSESSPDSLRQWASGEADVTLTSRPFDLDLLISTIRRLSG